MQRSQKDVEYDFDGRTSDSSGMQGSGDLRDSGGGQDRAGLREQSEAEAELTAAFAREEFEVWYQPQVDMRTGAIFGAEALVRWRHPRRWIRKSCGWSAKMQKRQREAAFLSARCPSTCQGSTPAAGECAAPKNMPAPSARSFWEETPPTETNAYLTETNSYLS